MYFDTCVTLRGDPVGLHERCWDLQDALSELEQSHILTGTVLHPFAREGKVEIEHYVQAADAALALRIAIDAICRSCSAVGGRWLLDQAAVAPRDPIVI